MPYLYSVAPAARLSLEQLRAAHATCLAALKRERGAEATRTLSAEDEEHVFALTALDATWDRLRGCKALWENAPSDVLLIRELPLLSQQGVLVMDMDMTAVQIEGIDEIARRVGVYEEVAAVTSRAMHGELDFAASLQERVSKLKSAKSATAILNAVKEVMTETPGLDSLLSLTYGKWQRGIASGGFTQLIGVLKERYHLEMVAANTLEIAEDRFTGRVASAIVDATGKLHAVINLMVDTGTPVSQCVVLGDGANDLPMLKAAGLGIAYHAKPKVVAEAPCALNMSDLRAVSLLLKYAPRL